MANIKSSKKRAQLAAQQNEVNSQLRSGMRNQIRKCQAAIVAGDEDKNEVLNTTISHIAKMGKKGIIHPRNADRKISRLQKQFNVAK